jgi:arginine N-succinyltransferase
MDFREADEFNGLHGTQFIADLMPKTPIYTAMLTEQARSVMGVPHPSGRAAMKMLENEGFAYDCYVDIFDGGPTMSAQTDQVRTIRDSQALVVSDIRDEVEGEPMMLAAGRLTEFVTCYGTLHHEPDGTAVIDRASAELLKISAGGSLLAMGR